jgi:hypothetical protein
LQLAENAHAQVKLLLHVRGTLGAAGPAAGLADGGRGTRIAAALLWDRGRGPSAESVGTGDFTRGSEVWVAEELGLRAGNSWDPAGSAPWLYSSCLMWPELQQNRLLWPQR